MLASGIPLAAKTVERIQEEMDHYGVSVRLTELGQATPLSGYYYGSAEDEIGMEVSVQVRAI